MSAAIDEFSEETIETGFVTATVNPAEPTELTPEGVQAAKALVKLPADLTPVQLAQLARDIAYDIAEMPVILQRYKLTQSQYEFIDKHNKFFIAARDQAVKDLQSIKSTEVRLRMQAQAALEQQMPVVASRMGNAAEKLGDVVEAGKFLAGIAGVDRAPTGPISNGERYQIVIDLGADANLVIAAKGGAVPGSVEASNSAVQGNSQGRGEPQTIRRDGQGQRNLRALPALPEG